MFAPSIVKPSPLAAMPALTPASVSTLMPSASAPLPTLPDSTWNLRIVASFSLFSGFSSDSTVPSGSAANAASVGANTVNGPSLPSVSARPAAPAAASSVLN